jgi:hypothetical protein
VSAKVIRGVTAKRHQQRISASLRANKFYLKSLFANYMNMGAVQSGRAGPIRDSLQTGGLFRKKAKFAAARHVPRESLPCEQRRVDFKKRDVYNILVLVGIVGYAVDRIHT